LSKLNLKEHVRDAFIFSCYTGLPYCDIYTLSSEDIKIGVDAVGLVKIEPEIPEGINEAQSAFLGKQQYRMETLYEGKLKDGRLLPVISNQKMNEYLAEIAAICQINNRLKAYRCHSRANRYNS